MNPAEAFGIDQPFRHGGGGGIISIVQFLIALGARQRFVGADPQLPFFPGPPDVNSA